MSQYKENAKPRPHTQLMLDHIKNTSRLEDGVEYKFDVILAELVRAGITTWHDIATSQIISTLYFHAKRQGWMTHVGSRRNTRYILNRASKEEEQQQKPLGCLLPTLSRC